MAYTGRVCGIWLRNFTPDVSDKNGDSEESNDDHSDSDMSDNEEESDKSEEESDATHENHYVNRFGSRIGTWNNKL